MNYTVHFKFLAILLITAAFNC
uniref:Uncharacterized protein n=1 Tax=Tetranychus urticae TaxID=32264 RepID=T1K2C3_TETUR